MNDNPEIPEEAREAVRSAIRTSLHTYANGDGDLTIYADELPELVSDILAALRPVNEPS